jgi:cytosine/adenosine deaminase-related metal-dependent hydrolase
MRLTLFTAAWVLPVAGPPIRDGAVLVDAGGRIAAVGPAAALGVPDGALVEELGRAALLPGLIDVHAHPELAMFRGALEDLAFPDWILHLVGAKRAWLLDEDYAWAARWSMVEAVRAGITTVCATEMSGASLGALREAGLRGIVYREVFGPDPAAAGGSMRELEGVVSTMREQETELVRVGVSPHAPYTVSDELFARAAEFARAESLPIAIHAAESAAERALVAEGEGPFAPGLRARGIATPPRGASTIRMLDRLGVLDARPLLIHCVELDADDVRRIADSGSAVAHCPVANARLGHGVAPLAELRDAGVRVGLGTDGVGSNNRLDLLEEARIASLLHRAARRSPDLMGPQELLRLCTIDGARALGWEDRVGTLEPGKDADLCAVSFDEPHVRPVHDPVAALFHAARGSDVVLAAVRGKVVFRRGETGALDVGAAQRGVEAAAERIRRGRSSGAAGTGP